MSRSRTILVTGGAGFIGSRFVAHHLRTRPADRVVVLDALTYAGSLDNLTCLADAVERVQFVHGSVRSTQIVESVLADCDAVVHLAAETHVPRSISDSSVFFETDVLGTQTMAALAVSRAPKLERFVHVSSSEVYGTALRDAMDEQHPLEPYTPYAAAKCAADRLIHAFVQTYATIPVTIEASVVDPQGTRDPAAMSKVLTTFRARQPVDKYAHVASLQEIADNDFNLNIPRYVDTFEEEEEIDVAAVEQEIERLESELAEVRVRMKQYLKELGV